jgi:hypothetical protein
MNMWTVVKSEVGRMCDESVAENLVYHVQDVRKSTKGFIICIRLPRTDFNKLRMKRDCICGLVVSVEDYKHRGPGFDSRALLRIFLRELGLERGPLSLVIG